MRHDDTGSIPYYRGLTSSGIEEAQLQSSQASGAPLERSALYHTQTNPLPHLNLSMMEESRTKERYVHPESTLIEQMQQLRLHFDSTEFQIRSENQSLAARVTQLEAEIKAT